MVVCHFMLEYGDAYAAETLLYFIMDHALGDFGAVALFLICLNAWERHGSRFGLEWGLMKLTNTHCRPETEGALTVIKRPLKCSNPLNFVKNL